MTLSIFQKLQIIIVRLMITPLWLMDYLAGRTYEKGYLKVFIYVLAIYVSGSLFYYPIKHFGLSQEYYKKLSLLHTGIVEQIYGTSFWDDQKTDNYVLGTSERAKKRPVLINRSAFPYITAKAHLVIDDNTGMVLSEHNINRAFAPASTTKLMTALVASELYSQHEVLEISPECTRIDSTKLWMPVGSKYTVKNLLYSLLVSSAGDAGCALSSSKVDMAAFIKLMNEKAAEIGMSNSQFTNPVGLDGEEGSHFSSVWDLYLLSQKIMEDPLLSNIVGTKTYSFGDITGELQVNLTSTNKLLWEIEETVGVKTGTTSGAGEVLIYKYQDKEKEITIIVMSSDDRFLDTRNLISWALSNYEWR